SGDLRGPDFFEQRVMDDPELNPLYDPQLDKTAHGMPTVSLEGPQLQLIHHEEQPVAAAPSAGQDKNAVTADVLKQLGVVVVSGLNNAQVIEVAQVAARLQDFPADLDKLK